MAVSNAARLAVPAWLSLPQTVPWKQSPAANRIALKPASTVSCAMGWLTVGDPPVCHSPISVALIRSVRSSRLAVGGVVVVGGGAVVVGAGVVVGGAVVVGGGSVVGGAVVVGGAGV